VPPPTDERELASLLSFFWQVDEVRPTLGDLVRARGEGRRPNFDTLRSLGDKYRSGLQQGLDLSTESRSTLQQLGIGGRVEDTK